MIKCRWLTGDKKKNLLKFIRIENTGLNASRQNDGKLITKRNAKFMCSLYAGLLKTNVRTNSNGLQWKFQRAYYTGDLLQGLENLLKHKFEHALRNTNFFLKKYTHFVVWKFSRTLLPAIRRPHPDCSNFLQERS